MDQFHWHYFLAIEEDIQRLARYIEFTPDNLKVYSIEIARLLMTATQEADTILKRLCFLHGDKSKSENGYRKFFPLQYPNYIFTSIHIRNFEFMPFQEWATGITPEWWTANNKIKHIRNKGYNQGTLESMLHATGALFLMNLLYNREFNNDDLLYPAPKLFSPIGLTATTQATIFGLIVKYELP